MCNHPVRLIAALDLVVINEIELEWTAIKRNHRPHINR